MLNLTHSIPRRHAINGRRQPMVALGYGVARVVGAQAELYHVVFIAEPRVMVEALGLGCYFGEKGEGRFKIGKAKATVEAIIGFSPHGFCYVYQAASGGLVVLW
jgi:hypothetical protein